MPLRASTCSYVAEWAAPIGRQRPFRRRQPTSDQEMERTGPCCFFWWCPPSQTAWLRVACALLLLCALLEEGEARRRRIFDDCPESRLPVAEADLVITATVERLLQDGAQVSVRVHRPLKGGPRELGGSVLLVEGLDNDALCGTRLTQGDTRLFLLKGGASEGRTRLLSSPLRVTLPNLDRLQAAVNGESYRRRLHERDLPCEAKYCPWNGDCTEDRLGTARCSCPTSCDFESEPVCATDGVTYPNRCKMRVESCRKQKRLWSRHQGNCHATPPYGSPY
uniref:Agrin n=1 Tax=Rhipicephalus appendiculatus TaxID=34631 RepID=A0A131YXG7_RHIAP